MKSVKSLIALLLVTVMLFSLAGCIKIDFSKFKKEEASTTDTTVADTQINNDITGDIVIDTVIVSESVQQSTVAPQTSTPTTQTATQQMTTPSTTNPPVTTNPVTTDTGVTTYSAEYGGKTQTVFYSQAILNDSRTYPVLIFANGTGFDYTLYKNLLIKLAENGYIVVANNETMAADGTAQIASLDFIISENSNSASALCGKINTEMAAAVGHSQGGRSAVNAAVKDPRFDCVLSLAGSNYTEEAEVLKTPTLFLAGTMDMIVLASKWVKPAYDVAKGPAVYASLVNGVHTSCCTDPETYVKYAVEWFDLWLKNDTGARSTFKNGGALSTDSAWTDFNCKNL